MKKTITLALLAAMTAAALAADTPADIAADYRAKSAPVLEKLNETLTKQAATIAAQLVSKGDTAGAEEVSSQVKAKTSNEPVANPHAAVAQLFTQYDTARKNALKPIQAAAFARIDVALKASGKDLAAVGELGKVRTIVEDGGTLLAAPKIPVEWTYHSTPEQKTPMATIHFREDGTFEMTSTAPGKWKSNKDGDKITVTFKDKPAWKIELGTDTGTIERPDVGVRYLRLSSKTSAAPVSN